MKSRKAIPNAGNSLLPMDIIDIYMSKNGAFEWFVYKKDKSGRLWVIVFSPTTPNGEMGTVMQHELDSVGAMQLTLTESLPPVGFHWERPTPSVEEQIDNSEYQRMQDEYGHELYPN